MKTGSLRADRSLSLGETLEGVKEHVRTNCETSPLDSHSVANGPKLVTGGQILVTVKKD